MSTFRRNFLFSALKPLLRDSTQCLEVDGILDLRAGGPHRPGTISSGLYRKGKTSAVGAMERKATTHVGSWLSLSCVPSPAKQVGTSRFRAEAMGNENSAPPAAGAWPDLQHKKRNATAELGRDRPGTETLGPLLKRKIKTAADQAASMLMPPPSSKCLYKHKATHQLGGDLLMNMIMAPPSINFNQFLEKEKLKGNGSNFTDWSRHVRIFLTGVSMQFVLEAPLGPPPPPAVSEDIKNVYETRVTRYSEIQCAILCSLEAELQKRFEHHDPCEMMRELKLIFETHAAVESYEASKQFFNCMMEEGSSVSEHMFAMSGHAKKLSDLGIVIPNKLGIHRVLQSLPPSYKNFVMNYNMQNMNKELPELFSMLKSAEVEIKKENQVLMVNKTTSFKKQGKPNKGNFKKGGKKVAAPPEKPKAGPKPETVCYYCQGKGHWKRNCTKYLADLKSGHAKKKGIFDIHVIDVYLTGSRSSAWVFDTGSVAHICNSKQELRNKRSLARDEVTMRVGNGSKVDVIAVGTLPLHLPSGLVLNLNNCYLVPALSMNIISGSCLMQDGYSFKSENNGCSIYMSNVFYGHAPEMNGLFLLNLDSSDTHVHNIDAKRIKLNDNSTYMWHCRLGHIGVKRMKKLHSDGLLESLDFESLDRCEACLMGKMTKTPFSGTMERATDLLEIIHTDVCGPMSVASRGGYRYVLTFTDDLSRYGYIYFMKHKSETFEKFKEFQSEVENQRNKKIKFLRSDRGGEYLSYEFGMHLKKCGILSQLTPPGTPQRNGVSERRNRTLLDMVRSMMSLTDLPLSFWGYALETAAFTLNRAPSKSVETTPYELWFGKKPKLSFLKVWGCDAYVKKLQPDKLEPKAEKCVFIGYPKETIGYTFYHRSEGKIFVAKNGSFLEKEFLTKEVTGRKVELDEVDEPSLIDQSSAVPEEVPVQPTPIGEEANDDDHETSNEEATEPRRSTRERTTPDWYDPCLNVMIVDNNDEDPATYEEAMMSPDSNKWQEAMKSEMGSMYDNKVWTLVDLPDSRKAVENKWIFKRKTDADGNITVYKARLVAKGFRQIQGVDYDETFSPVAKLKSAETAAPLLKWMQNEANEAAVRTMVPAPSSENLYKHEAMGQLGGDLLMNLDETSVPLLKWIKNDPDEAAVKMMVLPPSSENLLKHKATGQLGGTLFSKQTETAKPSLVKRIATAADEASAEAATKLLSPDGTGADVTKGNHTSTGTGFPLSCISTGSCTSSVYCIYPAVPYISIGSCRGPIYYTCPAGSCISTGSSSCTVYCTCPQSPASAPVPLEAPFTAPAQQSPASAPARVPAQAHAPAPGSPRSQLIAVATRVVTRTHLKAMFKLPKSISKDLNAGRRGKISLVMESEGLTVEGRYSVSPTDGRLAVTSRWKKFIDGAKLRIGSKLKVKIFRCRCDMLVIKFAVV
ncbi:hypothetical protein QYE76_001647 [Lolium multiflorum]|uniref:Uncharacterized protein n=1 Tax=Lolium multiflorum TaxID=4521 RepID=A0AAD8VXJ3_LOLMU|nr:hypothetical protein QYE76_001647 [Lolium multiflorum]